MATEQRTILSEGHLLVEISNGIVQEFRASVGKGPSKCKSHWAGRDLLVVLLRGGFTVAEQTLFDAGHKQAVQGAQQALHEAMEERLSKIVEELTGRRVIGFLSASRQSPDLRAELFLLEPDACEEAADAGATPGEGAAAGRPQVSAGVGAGAGSQASAE